MCMLRLAIDFFPAENWGLKINIECNIENVKNVMHHYSDTCMLIQVWTI